MHNLILNFRGNIMRDRSSKRKLLQGAGPPITGLAFKISAANVFLFVATNSSVLVYNITHKDKEQKVSLKIFSVTIFLITAFICSLN